MSATRKIASLAILCFAIGHSINAEVKTAWTLNLHLAPNKFVFAYEPLTGRNFDIVPRAHCDDAEANSEKRCVISRMFQDQQRGNCSITLKVKDTENRAVGDGMRMIQLGDDYVILLWYEEQRKKAENVADGMVKCSIVNMTTCESNTVNLHSSKDPWRDISKSSVVIYERSIDIMLPCSRNKFCKWSVNADGKVVKESQYFTADSMSSDFTSVTPRSNLKGYLQFDYGISDDELEMYLIKGGSKRPLKKISHLESHGCQSVSIAHDMIGVAIKNHSNVIVWQFDQEGKLKLDTTLSFENLTTDPTIHNLAEGGFLLLTSEHLSDRQETRHRVTKYDRDGKATGSLVIASRPDGGRDNLCDQGQSYDVAGFFENESKEYCLAFTCDNRGSQRMDDQGREYFGYTVKCFSDKDFKME